MNKLLKTISNEQNRDAHTENAAISNRSTMNSCVDLFARVGVLRGVAENEIISLFTKAFGENPLVALKILFWSRDIRSGAGERRTFRVLIKYLAEAHIDVMKKNLGLIPEFGRWDDYFEFRGTPLWNDVLELLVNQFKVDADSSTPSLALKWFPSNNTSSKESRKLAAELTSAIGVSPKEYRQTLSKVRARLRVVERDMSANKWEEINYERVPSRASMIYKGAFRRHDETRYQNYLDEVVGGTKKINAAALYPYDIVRKVLYEDDKSQTLDLQWKALPNYVEPFNGIVVADVSGSMSVCMRSQPIPMSVSISLAIYISERNTGGFKDYFITFSGKPSLEKIQGTTIYEKAKNLCQAHWEMNTNVQAVFDLLLKTAVEHNYPQEEMPSLVIIISDLQFDRGCSANNATNFECIKNLYKQANYVMPQLVFWNVSSKGKDFPITIHDTGTCLVSGCSPTIFKSVLNKNLNPAQIMLDTINDDRYLSVCL